MLEIKGLTKHFGGLAAVDGLDFSVGQEVLGLIGPNGAGKTTVFNLITGFLKPTKGTIIFNKENITGKSPHAIAEKGVVRTFQLTGIFRDFTVQENVFVSCHLCPKIFWLETLFNNVKSKKTDEQILNNVMEILKFTGLEKVKDLKARNLPHGYQRMLGIAIALAADPKLILLDEPLSGMNAGEVDQALDLIRKVRLKGIPVLLIEHNITAVKNICDRIVVINFGEKIAEGTHDEVTQDKEVIEAYLGVGYAAKC